LYKSGERWVIWCAPTWDYEEQTDYYTVASHLIGSTNGSATTYDLTDAEGSVLMSLSASAGWGEQWMPKPLPMHLKFVAS
jgi:hypothetical protein